jgi:hypothetical protein
VVKGKEKRLPDSLMTSELSSCQQEKMTKEDLKCILIIRGIEVFLSHSPVEVRAYFADATTTKGKPT